MGVPGGAKGALAEGPSPARYRGPACTPAGRDGPEDAHAQGILTAQVLLCPAPPARGTVATWPRMGDSAVPASPQTWALSPQLSRTCHSHTATAALGTIRQASLHPCHPRLAHGCTGMGPTLLGWDTHHSPNAGSSAGCTMFNFHYLLCFPRSPQLCCLLRRCQQTPWGHPVLPGDTPQDMLLARLQGSQLGPQRPIPFHMPHIVSQLHVGHRHPGPHSPTHPKPNKPHFSSHNQAAKGLKPAALAAGSMLAVPVGSRAAREERDGFDFPQNNNNKKAFPPPPKKHPLCFTSLHLLLFM